jgi:hypothetical protein
MYTRKQFQDVARILRTQVEREQRDIVGHTTFDTRGAVALKRVAEDFAAYFAFDNDSFDRERFMESAGFSG